MTPISRVLRPVSTRLPPAIYRSKSCHRRSYYSYEDPAAAPFSPTEDAILSAAFSHVPEHGFTADALAKGAREAGFLDITTNLFPDGPVALVKYHLVTQRLALSKSFPPPCSRGAASNKGGEDPTGTDTVPSKIRAITLHRLHANAPIIPHWQSALALLSQPTHTALGVRELALLVDEILFLAGSKAVTSAWYTDRAGLAAVYASAEMYMTTDASQRFQETDRFVERRLQEAERVKNGVGMLGTWVNGQFGGLLDGLRSKGVWI